MRIIVSGSTGLIGSALVASLTAQGHAVTRLVRNVSSTSAGAVFWDPSSGTIDESALEGHDALVHLAGKNIASERWTPAVKAQLKDSRLKGMRLLSEALARLSNPPRVMITASGIGYYGDRGTEILSEDSPPGKGFLSDIAREIEACSAATSQNGVRTVIMRTGWVLSPEGGGLSEMLVPFRLGLGGRIGSGQQYVSWITLDDTVGAIEFLISHPELSGPVNVVAPHPVTNAQFTKALAQVLSRPAILPLPAAAVRLIFGGMGTELLLSSTRVEPARLAEAGYAFRYPEINGALRHLLSARH